MASADIVSFREAGITGFSRGGEEVRLGPRNGEEKRCLLAAGKRGEDRPKNRTVGFGRFGSLVEEPPSPTDDNGGPKGRRFGRDVRERANPTPEVPFCRNMPVTRGQLS